MSQRFVLFGPCRALLSKTRDHNRRGVTAVEFALIAPVFFLMLIGVTELSLVFLVEHLLENAAYNASRTAKTGYIEAGRTQLDTVMLEMNKRISGLSPLVNPALLVVTSTAYANLSAIGQPDQGEEGLGAAEQVVVYTISYPWQFFTPVVGDLMGDENRIMNISSRIVVRNEPYDD